MAIHGLDGNSITNINIGGGESATTQPTANVNANTNTNNSAQFTAAASNLTFGNNDIFMLSDSTGAEQCNRLAAHIKKLYAENIPQSTIRVDVLDKQTAILNIAYSAIIISNKTNNEVSYYTVVVPPTGREAKTAGQMAAELTNLQNRQFGQNQQIDIFTYDEVIDSYYDESTRNLLKNLYKDLPVDKMFSLDGVILPRHPHDEEAVATVTGILASRYIAVDAALSTDRLGDLNLKDALDRAGVSMLKISKAFTNAPSKNQLGEPIRANWSLLLEKQDNNKRIASLNNNSSVEVLTNVSGFVDAIPDEVVQAPMAAGLPSARLTRFHPHIIITNASVNVPTPGYLLLALLSALPMVNKSMWSAPLIHNINNVRFLNRIANLEGNPDGVGVELDLNSKKTSEEDIKNFINQIFTLDPIISLDVQSFGPQTFYTSLFSNGASPAATEARQRSLQTIIETANHLTNGAFPLSFDPNRIFMTSGVTVPLGVWTNNKGVEQDLREIDLAFVCANNPDIKAAYDWALSTLPRERTAAGDPFATKVMEIAKLTPDAVVSGRAIRVTFTAEFITMLSEAAKACGFNFTYEPEVRFESNNINWSNVGGILSTGGINSTVTSGMAREFVGATPTAYYNPYGNAGAYRW